MSDGNAVVAHAVVRDRFANAPVLPFERGAQWFAAGRQVAWGAPFFLPLATLLTLLARWQLDLFGTGNLIVLSYLSDAIVFTWVFMGIGAQRRQPGLSPWRAGHQDLAGRWRVVAVCSLWGLPAALVSYAMFAFAPDLVKALVLLLGSNGLGLAAVLVLGLAAAYATFLLSLLPVLAAIQAGRDVHANFKIAGLWALRALRAGHRPLAVVFVSFVTGCVLAGAGLTYLYGHVPSQWLLENPGLDALLNYWYPWPGLFAALWVFLAMLHPMASDLLQAADVDLSDEILAPEHKAHFGERHVGWVLCQFGFGMRSLAALCVLLGLLYASVLGGGDFMAWMGSATLLYLGGKLLTAMGRQRRQRAAAREEAAGAAAAQLPWWVRWAHGLLTLSLWFFLLGALGVSALLGLGNALTEGRGGWDVLWQGAAFLFLPPLVLWGARWALRKRYPVQ